MAINEEKVLAAEIRTRNCFVLLGKLREDDKRETALRLQDYFTEWLRLDDNIRRSGLMELSGRRRRRLGKSRHVNCVGALHR